MVPSVCPVCILIGFASECAVLVMAFACRPSDDAIRWPEIMGVAVHLHVCTVYSLTLVHVFMLSSVCTKQRA